MTGFISLRASSRPLISPGGEAPPPPAGRGEPGAGSAARSRMRARSRTGRCISKVRKPMRQDEAGRLTWAASLSGTGEVITKYPENSANAHLLWDRDSSFSYAVVRPGGIACGCDDAGTARRLLGGSRCTPDTPCVRTPGSLRATRRARGGGTVFGRHDQRGLLPRTPEQKSRVLAPRVDQPRQKPL